MPQGIFAHAKVSTQVVFSATLPTACQFGIKSLRMRMTARSRASMSQTRSNDASQSRHIIPRINTAFVLGGKLLSSDLYLLQGESLVKIVPR